MNFKPAREKLFPYNETTLRKLVISATVMYFWILIWALVLKLGDEGILIRNYTNLKELTLWERILWDLIPFNYRPAEGGLVNLLLDTLLNCFVFAPIGVAFGYLFKKTNILRDAAICLGISLLIELAHERRPDAPFQSRRTAARCRVRGARVQSAVRPLHSPRSRAASRSAWIRCAFPYIRTCPSGSWLDPCRRVRAQVLCTSAFCPRPCAPRR